MDETPAAAFGRRTASAATAIVVSVVLGAVPLPASADPPATCAGMTATIVGTDGDDRITGTDGDDVVSLGAGSDAFSGDPGDDVICGGRGRDELIGDERGAAFDDADQVYGGAGDDTIGGEPGEAIDEIDGGSGTDIISFYLSGRSVAIDVGARTATGDAADTFRGLEVYLGSEFADVLKGSSGAESLFGVHGDDTIIGRRGDDRLSARRGTVIGGRGRDTFAGPDEEAGTIDVDLGRGDDVATFDAIAGGTARGGPGDDFFAAPGPQSGFDPSGTYARLLGGSGDDVLSFGRNVRRVRVDVFAGTARWWQGRFTFAGIDEFRGSSRNDVLLGSASADRLSGNGGDDVLRGRRGPDRLTGGPGEDAAYGGDGRDRCSAERRFSCERG